MITISISMKWADPPPRPNLHARVHHISEIMPHVLASHGLASSDQPNVTQPTPATNATDLFDAMFACLEEALAT
jgi:hypothetical protein